MIEEILSAIHWFFFREEEEEERSNNEKVKIKDKAEGKLRFSERG